MGYTGFIAAGGSSVESPVKEENWSVSMCTKVLNTNKDRQTGMSSWVKEEHVNGQPYELRALYVLVQPHLSLAQSALSATASSDSSPTKPFFVPIAGMTTPAPVQHKGTVQLGRQHGPLHGWRRPHSLAHGTTPVSRKHPTVMVCQMWLYRWIGPAGRQIRVHSHPALSQWAAEAHRLHSTRSVKWC